MNRVASAAIVALITTTSSVALADPLEQDNQIIFGAMGAYVPAQNSLRGGDLALLGSYAAYSHSLDFVYLGFRLAFLYGWFPNGAAGQQYVIEPDVLLGVRWRVGKPIALRFEVGSGPLANGGEGFTTTITNHTYVRASFQWTIFEALTLEAFGGPSFVIGPYAAAVFAEFGLGAGWNF